MQVTWGLWEVPKQLLYGTLFPVQDCYLFVNGSVQDICRIKWHSFKRVTLVPLHVFRTALNSIPDNFSSRAGVINSKKPAILVTKLCLWNELHKDGWVCRNASNVCEVSARYRTMSCRCSAFRLNFVLPLESFSLSGVMEGPSVSFLNPHFAKMLSKVS